MKAAVLHGPGAKLAIEEIQLEKPRRGEVLVEIAASGVCFSDWHLITGATPHPLPAIPGHEGAGIVLQPHRLSPKWPLYRRSAASLSARISRWHRLLW